ncbi:MAG: PD-(D/E)XK nuclease family protein [Phycisphaeraceae bacterium]
MSGETTDLQALERFVAENDDLLSLETRIGRFNIFDALGVVNAELRHSNFLAWLLDPGESHGLGGLFLRAVLMDLLRQTPIDQRLFSPIKLDGGELRGIEIRREWRNIDLLITCDDPSFVIAIENKIGSSEHSNQLARYQRIVTESSELSKYERHQFVYLTKDGDEPSEEDWTIYSYAALYRVLTKVRAANAEQIGDDVRAFLDHYLRLIGSRFMDDPEIIELCTEIYKNHRQAIDLIVENAASGASPAVDAMQSVIDAHPQWQVLKATSREVFAIPNHWQVEMPRVAAGKQEQWLYYSFNIWDNGSCGVNLCMLATNPVEFRDRCMAVWMESPAEYGMRKRTKSLSPDWNSLNRKSIEKWGENNEPPTERIEKKVTKLLDQLYDESANTFKVIKSIDVAPKV